MKRSFIRILAVALMAAASCSPQNYNHKVPVRQIEADALTINYQEAIERTLEWKNVKKDTLQFDFTYWGGWRDSKFYSAKDTIVITNDGVEQEFVYWTSGKDTIVLDIYKQFCPGNYDNSYKANNKGKVNVVVPPVYELAHVLFSLTHSPKPHWVKKETAYFKRVHDYFSPYRDHPVITKLQDELDNNHFLNIRENSAAYVFDGQKIVSSSTYRGFRARDRFKKLLPLVQDFATKSNFLSFYQKEQAFYKKLEALEREKAQIAEAWNWLQNQFPSKVDSYRIIMSPLAGGSHSIRLFENNGFKENIIFVSAPSIAVEGMGDDDKEDVQTMRRAFTEIDHNYVNPVSDQYLQEIEEAMSKIEKWNIGNSYQSPYATFNEYMTWAVFGLYVYDRFGEAAYNRIMPQPTNFMESKRGFIKFKAFNKYLLELFRYHQGNKKVPDLYPEMLAWVKKENYSS